MFEIYIFTPYGKAATTPSYTTENPVEAADIVDMLKQLYNKGMIECIYVYCDKHLIEYHER